MLSRRTTRRRCLALPQSAPLDARAAAIGYRVNYCTHYTSLCAVGANHFDVVRLLLIALDADDSLPLAWRPAGHVQDGVADAATAHAPTHTVAAPLCPPSAAQPARVHRTPRIRVARPAALLCISLDALQTAPEALAPDSSLGTRLGTCFLRSNARDEPGRRRGIPAVARANEVDELKHELGCARADQGVARGGGRRDEQPRVELGSPAAEPGRR